MNTVHIIVKTEGDRFDPESFTDTIVHVFQNPLDARSELVAHGTPNSQGKVWVLEGEHLTIWRLETHDVL